MSLLHDYFHTRNLQAFQRLLDGSAERGQLTSAFGPASSFTPGGGKSWNRGGGIGFNHKNPMSDVNSKDWLGRTALHLASISVESIEYVRALLKHPQVDVNLPDTESHWTPLHRALYFANFSVALLLLQRSDIDSSLKDLEGYTAFDLYNSTLNGTKPPVGDLNAELYTWGVNRNAALGVGDVDDRSYPEHVCVKTREDPVTLTKMTLSIRFSPISVKHIQMSKLHTAIITSDLERNLRLCGFGNGGRLGSARHTQYNFEPVPSFNLQIISVALGQDHTLALTKSGEVYSWGLNRFSQLGYVVEVSNTSINRYEEPIQYIPKRVVGLLKKEFVRGVAASRNASACWTKDTVFTWGTNTGQLGYDKTTQPVQSLPRPVTKFTNAVIDLAMSETVLAALLATRQVECIWSDRHFRINFPMHSFPANIQPYRPPQSIKDAHIVKITSCEEIFAALSSNGEVFTFSANSSPDIAIPDVKPVGPVFKPQKAWALRKKFSAVKDVSIGSDGSMIICTESGHVYVRTRNTKSSSNKAFKYERISSLQRITRVCTNSTGALAALRIDHRPNPIEVIGNTIAQDLKAVQPYSQFYDEFRLVSHRQSAKGDIPSSMIDEELKDADIASDIEGVLDLIEILSSEREMRKARGGRIKLESIRLPHDADTAVHVQSGVVFPAHRVILAARCFVLESILSGRHPVIEPRSSLSIRLVSANPGPGVAKITCLSISGCHPLTVLILLRYLYSDELIALWDRRVSTVIHTQLMNIGADPGQIKSELQLFARLLDLPVLSEALEHPVKRQLAPTMAQDMLRLFNAARSPLPINSPLAPDVILQLADKEVYTHSLVLRCRSPLFASFFDLEDWTVKRWEANGTIRLNMTHMNWHILRFVLSFMCCGSDKGVFDVLDFIDSGEGLLQFMFDVAAAANELLLDRLILICASVILSQCNLQNACYILADATYYHIQPLIDRMQEYICINMEAFLQGHMLDEIPYDLVKQLTRFAKARQLEKSPFSRSDVGLNEMLKRHATWLEEQDIPGPIIRTASKGILKKETSASKLLQTSVKKAPQKTCFTAHSSAATSFGIEIRHPSSPDDIFTMDEPESPGQPPSFKGPPALAVLPPTSPPIWKPTSVPRVDMKAIMAEAQAATKSQSSTDTPGPIGSRNATQQSKAMVDVQMPHSRGDVLSTSKSSSKSGFSSPWRINDQSITRPPPPTIPTSSTLVSRSASHSLPLKFSSTTQQTQVPQSTPARTQPGLGPMITPKWQVQPQSDPKIRSASGSGKAWSFPPVQLPTKTTPVTGMSFVAIQDSQKQLATVKDTRSFREIQEEEQSLQVEADFLKWWTAEEERVRLEALALVQFDSNIQDRLNVSASKKAGHSKQKPKVDGKIEQVAGPSTSQSNHKADEQNDNPKAPHKRRRAQKTTQKQFYDAKR